MSHLLCCSLFLQDRLAYFIGAMQGIKMRLQFLIGKALYRPAVTSYTYITICFFFAFLSFPPVDHELLATCCFWLFSLISKTLLLCWQGHSHSGLKYAIKAQHKHPCSQKLKVEMPASCKRLRALWDRSHNHRSAELPLHPVPIEFVPVSGLQGLGCSLVQTQQRGNVETNSRAGKVSERSCPPTLCSRLGQLQSQSCVQSSFEYLQERRFHNLCG